MKKVLLLLLISLQGSWLLAQTYPSIYVRYENTKFYRQPAYSAEVIGLLKLTDQVQMVRKFKDRWVIVKVNGQSGYVERWNVTKKQNRQKTKSSPDLPLIVVEKQD